MKILSVKPTLLSLVSSIEQDVDRFVEESNPDNKKIRDLQLKVKQLTKQLNNMFIRDDVERQHDIDVVISGLFTQQYEVAKQWATTHFNSDWFKAEPDVEFKVALSKALLNFFVNYNNGLWIQIAERDPKVFDLLYGQNNG